MKSYISTKLVKAKPMTRGEYNKFRGWDIPKNENPNDEGYLIQYPDEYISWCPKKQFEESNLKVDDNKNLASGVSIGSKMVDDFIKEVHVSTLGDKTTLVRAILVNGFEIVESTGCVDKANYSEDIGAEICLNKIKDKIWYLLGFLLQTAYNGVN
ncbi:Gp49 family protein [Clostridium perfringens]|uniref:Gp49 n=1 Tax=Clostridium perfringens E str. JGS1987 TaxID=451755 RepID=B1BWE0_CLOPF|nr:Gp49 family protein [Clostridium perfringens]EDT14005.1 gp49 [Clostridium perfringens E str. JGS1987]